MSTTAGRTELVQDTAGARTSGGSGSRLSVRLVFALVLLVAFLHGLLYAIVLPPWDVSDEEQHLAYTLTLWNERRIPRISEYMPQSILDSAAATDRWGAYHMPGRPESHDVRKIGLEGLQYEGYQPPVYYAILAPVAALGGGDVLRAMYLARLLGPFLLAALAAIAWGLAAAWFPSSGAAVRAGAALLAGSFPSAAAAAGRVNNDLLGAVLVAGGLLAATRLLARPDRPTALLTGLVAMVAILTKAPGFLLLPVIFIALGWLWRKGRLSSAVVALALGPGLVAGLAWEWWTHHTYGVWQGTSAFLQVNRPFTPEPPKRFLELILFNTWESYTGAFNRMELKAACLVVVLIIGGLALVGLLRGPLPIGGLLLAAVLGLGFLVTLWTGNQLGLVPPQGRVILALFPPLAALIAGGWGRLVRGRGALLPAGLAWAATLIYSFAWFVPYYR